MEIRRRQFVALKLEMLVIYIQNSTHNHCKLMPFFLHSEQRTATNNSFSFEFQKVFHVNVTAPMNKLNDMQSYTANEHVC